MTEPIPADDILEAYAKLPKERRSAVTNLIRAPWYVGVCTVPGERAPGKGPNVLVDWEADQKLSIYMIVGLAGIGRDQFGETWLRTLRAALSQMA